MVKEEKKEKKYYKKIKIGKIEIGLTKSDVILTPILIIIMILYFLSPDIYLVKTAKFGMGSDEDNKNVITALGEENTEEKFLIYFQWYNVLHELGHGVLHYNSDKKLTDAEEEQLVNDFATAYWLYYGEEEKINIVADIAEYAVNHIDCDNKENLEYMEFAEKNWGKSSFNTFNNYGWFQFSSVKESLKNRKSLEEVLKEMEIDNVTIPEVKLHEYPVINEETSTMIINDAVNNFHEIGLEFPEVYQSFSDNPNSNYSRPAQNIFRIYDLMKNK